MQAIYVDKYEEELMKAVDEGQMITSDESKWVPYMRYIGTVQGIETKHYYAWNDKYYFESDFAKHMRLLHRQRDLKKRAKR